MRIPVEQPAGAFLMVRRAVWQELGGFDESFFPLWFEDVDFCRRASIGAINCFMFRKPLRASGRALNFAAIGRETPRLLVW
jgi:predicted glycosyltransferase involved in capsule biosynthesis